jgi:hypothetical protein
MKIISGLISLLLFPIWVLASDLPDYSANYLVKLNGLQAGELRQSLKSNESGIREFHSLTEAKGVFALFKSDLVEESSQWQIKDNFIQPLRYSYSRTGGKREKFMFLDFDWPNKTLHIDDKKQPWSLSLESKTLDKLVYQLALMRDLATHKTEFEYQIADGGKLKTYHIEILGEELITTPLGKIKTIKLKRHREVSKGRETVLWCAPSLQYLPVMLEHTEKGGSIFTAVLRQLKGISTVNAFIPLPSSNTGFLQ